MSLYPELDRKLNELSTKRQKLRDRIDRSRRELDAIEMHIREVQRETTERLLQDERVDNALIEHAFQKNDKEAQR